MKGDSDDRSPSNMEEGFEWIFISFWAVKEEDRFDFSSETFALICLGCIRPLSPSAERLTLSTKAPPRAIQTLKSQIFLGDTDFEGPEEGVGRPQEKGRKREFFLRDEFSNYLTETEFWEAESAIPSIFTSEGKFWTWLESKFYFALYESYFFNLFLKDLPKDSFGGKKRKSKRFLRTTPRGLPPSPRKRPKRLIRRLFSRSNPKKPPNFLSVS